MKILIAAAAPWSASAYGQQAGALAKHLGAEGHDVVYAVLNGLALGPLSYEGVTCIPAVNTPPESEITQAIRTFKPDILITMVDLFVFQNFKPDIPWIAWFPVDTFPVSPVVLKILPRITVPISFSMDGATAIHAIIGGIEERGVTIRKCLYVPCMVEDELMRSEKPTIEEQTAARHRIGVHQTHDVVVSIVADNNSLPSRKALPEQYVAFSLLREQYPEAILYHHATPYSDRGGLNLIHLCDSLGLVPDRDVVYPPHYAYMNGLLDRSYVTAIYDASDVLFACSASEGFGIPIVEAQFRHRPAIVSDGISMRPLATSQGLAATAGREWSALQRSWWVRPHPRAITQRAITAIQHPASCMLGTHELDKYKASTVLQQWSIIVNQTLMQPGA